MTSFDPIRLERPCMVCGALRCDHVVLAHGIDQHAPEPIALTPVDLGHTEPVAVTHTGSVDEQAPIVLLPDEPVPAHLVEPMYRPRRRARRAG